MKNLTLEKILLIIAGIFILTILVSCETEEFNQPLSQSESTIHQSSYVNPIPDEMIGNYEHHLYQEIKGTISIYKDSIIINTDVFDDSMMFEDSDIEYHKPCYLKYTTFNAGKIVKLTRDTKHSNYVMLSIDDNGVKYDLGVFDRIDNNLQ